MQIDVSVRRKIEHPLRDNASVRHNENGFGTNVFQLRAEFEVVLDLLRLHNRDSMRERNAFYRRRLHLHTASCGTVRLRDHKSHLVPSGYDRFEGGNSELRSATEDEFQG